MAATKEGRPMHPTFEAAHQAFVDEYLALYHGFPKYLEYLVLGFGWGELIAHARLDDIVA